MNECAGGTPSLIKTKIITSLIRPFGLRFPLFLLPPDALDLRVRGEIAQSTGFGTVQGVQFYSVLFLGGELERTGNRIFLLVPEAATVPVPVTCTCNRTCTCTWSWTWTPSLGL